MPKAPPVSYRNLSLTHLVPPKAFQGFRSSTATHSAARRYVEWCKGVVKESTLSGDRVLIVVHRALVKVHQVLPYATSEPLEDLIPGRTVHIIWWGSGIGSNEWKDCNRVFLFGEFHKPRRVYVGTALGVTETQAGDANLAEIQGGRFEGDARSVADGDLLRWTKQLACRGSVRNIDGDGVCAPMKLYSSMDFGRLMAQYSLLFPDAYPPIRKSYDPEGDNTPRGRLITLLCNPVALECLSSEAVQEITGGTSGQLSRRLNAKMVRPYVAAYGWTLVAARSIGKPGKAKYLVRQAYLETFDTLEKAA